MSTAIKTTDTSSSLSRADLSSPQFPFSMDCLPFLNWEESDDNETYPEKGVVFRSLVAALNVQPVLDESLETKAVQFLNNVDLEVEESADSFLSCIGRTTDESLTCFVQLIVVLVSSPQHVIKTATMEMLESLIQNCSAQVHLSLVQADLIPHIFTSLSSQSLCLIEAVDIHTNLMEILQNSLWLATPGAQADLEIEGDNAQQAVHKTVLKQVLVPLEKYILHLCVNRFSINDGDQSLIFLSLLANLLRISPYSQPTMDFVLNMPVVLTIPSCLTFFENEDSFCCFLTHMNSTQRNWNETRGAVRQMSKTALQMLRMEGIEDVMEEKLRNDKSEFSGNFVVSFSIQWNNRQGMNLPEEEEE
ncbi:hypothetical protein BLNAU_20753 [Blattamonas nauphoetae]|uniref:Uncharacterized protein n=1 Tax=Blattamonas nauphoetae TaxID=2049346 RepID=A0ABQ9WYB2_9EUKA|nr:hypothetical protein BLNAU_20753 [Blattamonas nauphoetae]